MSSSLFVLQSCTGISIILSTIYFIISTIYLDAVTKHYDAYSHPDFLRFVLVLSIWLSLFQLGVNTVIFKRLQDSWKFWCLDQLVVFCITVIAFAVAMSEHANKIGGSTGNAFVGFSAIKFTFSSVAILVIFLLGRQDAFSPGY